MEKFDETTTPELSTGGGFRLSKPLGGCLWDPIKATLIKRLQKIKKILKIIVFLLGSSGTIMYICTQITELAVSAK